MRKSIIRIGRFLHISNQGKIILRAYPNFIPKLNSEVLDKEMKSIGRVFDFFGPVASPYISVNPIISQKNLERLIGENLYQIKE